MSRYVIGDIHGCLDDLRRLIDGLPVRAGDVLVFLGDYNDRGPDSAGVVSYLIALQREFKETDFVFLKGNHEDMFLSFLGVSGQHGDVFLRNGGEATLASYGVSTERASPEEALSALPEGHLPFFKALQRYHLMDSFLCVHAGVHPRKSLAEQSDEELFWIRSAFIYSTHRLPYTILFGHTPQPTVFYDVPYKVGLDTGLVYGNMLTCLNVDEKVLYQIKRGKKSVSRSAVQRKWDSASARH
jgi:diadenosine tetraphosphatase ApaH/serine/threonine PP2A family protein phosphatase